MKYLILLLTLSCNTPNVTLTKVKVIDIHTRDCQYWKDILDGKIKHYRKSKCTVFPEICIEQQNCHKVLK